MEEIISVFNPDNDLALANDNENYIPPSSIVQMASDLSYLPVWYQPANSKVLCSEPPDPAWLEEIRKVIDTTGLFVEKEKLANEPFIPFPWGWNKMLIKQFKLLGIEEKFLLSPALMEEYKKLSHRELASRFLSSLQLNHHFCGNSFVFNTVESIRDFITAHPRVVLKAPYSSSGKGLCWCKGEITNNIHYWYNRTLKKQGSVVGEIVYEKVEDFAMQFYSDGKGRVQFKGYSCFVTDKNGLYKGNLLMSDRRILEWLHGYVSPEQFTVLQEKLLTLLTTELGSTYKGYLGVDMMICEFEDKPEYRILPCIEINLRTTMGIVTRNFYDRYIDESRSGEFFIDYFPDSKKLLELHREAKRNYPLTVENGKITGGYLSLSPVTEQAHYRAWALIR